MVLIDRGRHSLPVRPIEIACARRYSPGSSDGLVPLEPSRMRVGQPYASIHEGWRARPAFTEAVARGFVLADASAEVDHAAAVIEQLLGRAITGGEPSPTQHWLASVISDVSSWRP